MVYKCNVQNKIHKYLYYLQYRYKYIFQYLVFSIFFFFVEVFFEVLPQLLKMYQTHQLLIIMILNQNIISDYTFSTST